jgi:hypothetical protein
MPLYRDDQGNLYHSHRADLTGEAVRPSPVQMPEEAWLRVAQVRPGWVGLLPKAATGLFVLSFLLLAGFAPTWLLAGPEMAAAMLGGIWLLLNAIYFPLLQLACRQVPMNRPLRLILSQPRGLTALELLRPWSGLAPLSAVLLILIDKPVVMNIQPWLIALLGLLALAMLFSNIRFIRRLRRAAAGVRTASAGPGKAFAPE